MSTNSLNLAIETFRAAHDTAYQSGAKLKSRVRWYSGIRSASHHFPVIPMGRARRRARNTPIQYGDLGNARPRADLEERDSFQFLDWQDQAITNVSEMQAMGESTGYAFSRSYDEDIVDALGEFPDDAYRHPRLGTLAQARIHQTVITGAAAGGYTKNAGTAGQVSSPILAKAASILMGFGAHRDMCTIVLPATQFEYLAADNKLTSSDYIAGNRVTEEAALSRIYQCQVVLFDDLAREDGQGALHGAVDQNGAAMANRVFGFMFHKNACSYAQGMTRLGVVEWLPERRGHHVGAEGMGVAKATQLAGIVRIVI